MRQPVLVGSGGVQPITSYGFKPALVHSASLTATNQQLVPYNPAQVAQMYPHLAPQEKKPLTPDELQRLYSLNQVPSYNLSAATVGVVPRPLPGPSFSTPAVATQPPYYASYSMPYGGTQVVPPPSLAQQPQVLNQPQSAYIYPQLNMQVVATTALAQQGASAIDAAPKVNLIWRLH